MMRVKKVLTVFGTRPEAIKMAPVIQELKRHGSKFESIVCITAQHREMLDQVLQIFGIMPDYDLNIMRNNQDLFDITENVLRGLKDILAKERPDIVLVQGDTTTAFIAGLSAFYLKIPVGHIEAGLRTYNKYSPFPEEKNRQLLSDLADIHFAPTEWTKSNLLREGIAAEKIRVTGNTVIDSLLSVAKKQATQKKQRTLEDYFRKKWDFDLPSGKNDLKLILVTGHRRENFGEGFKNICFALKEIAQKREDVLIVYPVHLNPNIQKTANAILKGVPNIHLLSPLEYEPFAFLMTRAYVILTDSGGIQEEAPSLGKPVLVMRDTTERPEGIEAGTAKLVGTKKDMIVAGTIEVLDNKLLYSKMSKIANPYGNGKSAERIVKALSKHLSVSR